MWSYSTTIRSAFAFDLGPLIFDGARDVVLGDGADDPERFRHIPVLARIRLRASSGVSARAGSFCAAATRRSNSVKWDFGAGKDSRGMLAQSSSINAIFSAGLAACSSGISASFIGASGASNDLFVEPSRARGRCSVLQLSLKQARDPEPVA